MAGLRKILLVEDNPELRKMYETFLNLNGFTVASAIDGEDGVAKAHDFKPDLIFLDIMMPKMDGFEVLKILRHDESYNCTKTKIVMLTNLGDSKLSPQTRKDMDGYVIKAEIVLGDLLEVVKSLDKPN
ncbi:MAG TPA: response regulator [Magnetospirillaceae bacterium]|nr:response regulator [Magnetospirillaceae bacterium]